MNIPVNAGGNLQAAIDQAQPDDVLVLEAGATFEGCFATNKPLTMTSSGPLPDRKLTPTDVVGLPILRTPASGPALATVGNASQWRLTGINFAAGSSTQDVVVLGDGAIRDVAALPRNLVFDRCAVTVQTTAKRGIQLNCAETTLKGCCVTGVKLAGQESQALCGWNGAGPFTIEDCYLEAGSIGVLFGGAGPSIPNLTPTGITFRRNTITRPVLLRGGGFAVKNLFELKNARDVIIEGNLFEHNWPDGQAGYAIVFTVRGQTASAPWSTIQHVRFEHNVVRKSGAGFNIMGKDDTNPSTPMDDVLIRNNLFYEIDRQDWADAKGTVACGVIAQISNEPRNLRFEQNTFMGAGSITGNITALYGAPSQGFVFARNLTQKLMTPYQTYGVNGDKVGEGNPALARYAPSCQFVENVLAGCTPSVYSNHPGQHFPTVDALTAEFLDPASGNFRLREGSPFTGLGVDQDALEAAFAPPVTEPPPIEPPPTGSPDDVIRALADEALAAVPAIGGDVAPQDAAQHAIESYRDALLEAL
jgi:hypothetical protein